MFPCGDTTLLLGDDTMSDILSLLPGSDISLLPCGDRTLLCVGDTTLLAGEEKELSPCGYGYVGELYCGTCSVLKSSGFISTLVVDPLLSS